MLRLASNATSDNLVVGESDPEGGKQSKDEQPIANLHATVLKALGIDWEKNLRGPLGRTVPRSQGRPIGTILT